MLPATTQVKAILNPHTAVEKFQFTRYLPSPELAYFVDWYWLIHWDLRGQEPYTQDVLTYPCVQFVVEAGASGVFGLTSGKFSRTLVGKGRVVAAKFHAGGFYPYLRSSISALTDHQVPISSIFGEAGAALERAILATEDDQQALHTMDSFLCERLPERDPNVALVNSIIDCISSDRTITRVDELVSRIHMSKRSLQRLFSEYVGISPKWVIQRYRLQEAVDQLVGTGDETYTAIAHQLGYFDQAHFIKDFKMAVGVSPAEYARLAHPTV
ncbi:MAG: helix-turn-helix domain-containing protein [Chloroflexi bacterium]|nr:helix-turn-helix domain-containing protein [Chloroflexota bacterium]MCC6894368.1 AraC family transcriptional regulator [Anaerolineae bacterium]